MSLKDSGMSGVFGRGPGGFLGFGKTPIGAIRPSGGSNGFGSAGPKPSYFGPKPNQGVSKGKSSLIASEESTGQTSMLPKGSYTTRPAPRPNPVKVKKMVMDKIKANSASGSDLERVKLAKRNQNLMNSRRNKGV